MKTKKKKNTVRSKDFVMDDGTEVVIRSCHKIPNKLTDFWTDVYKNMRKGDSIDLCGADRQSFMATVRNKYGAGKLLTRECSLENLGITQEEFRENDNYDFIYRIWKL